MYSIESIIKPIASTSNLTSLPNELILNLQSNLNRDELDNFIISNNNYNNFNYNNNNNFDNEIEIELNGIKVEDLLNELIQDGK